MYLSGQESGEDGLKEGIPSKRIEQLWLWLCEPASLSSREFSRFVGAERSQESVVHTEVKALTGYR